MKDVQPMATAPKDGTRIMILTDGTGGGWCGAKWMGTWWGFDRAMLAVPVGWKPDREAAASEAEGRGDE